jgi:hypothetical protein
MTLDPTYLPPLAHDEFRHEEQRRKEAYHDLQDKRFRRGEYQDPPPVITVLPGEVGYGTKL